ncbi:Ger(x)C family spore germination protein [Paenibacillus radicis (ex Gao et al. 2016)]|uniref:Germination protein GerAC n=1 Tax=Paenibacillus radicis (ex Gao et al. 2016) TaxID=1737354 RepID=A0A917H934_9BACL|nr:Ger(x)C family spore germination protein [Paenibacillus radicis (ex Gao et al. 2016)]GGG71590.1 germination protein GerAC [Paenibacillus radicis (ex Gao et al. 2016)]
MAIRKMYRILSIPLATSLCLLLTTGCWDRVEVNDLAIVTGAGFDLTDDNKIKLTIQIFDPGSSSESSTMGGSPSNERKQPLLESAVGLNTADAASKLQELLSRKFFWGQADIFVFGEKLAKHGIQDPMDFLTRHPHPRERANMYISKGNADSILQWEPHIERNSSEVLREMSALQSGLDIKLLDVIVQLGSDVHTTVIPWVSMKTSDNKPTPYLGGYASFQDLKLNHWYNQQKTRGLLWLRNEIMTATLTAKPGDDDPGVVSLQLLDTRCRLTPSIQGNKWRMKVTVTTKGDLVQSTSSMDVTKLENIEKLEDLFEGVITKRISSAVQTAQKSNTDVLLFAREYHRHYPKQYDTAKLNWKTIFPAIEVEYETEMTILRTGLIGKNTSLSKSRKEGEGP